jgi:hypothetical protein
VNSYIITDKKDEDKFSNEINSEEYFCQELIYGEKEYATHMIFSKGMAIHSINIEYKYGTDIYIKGKNKWLYAKKVDCQYINFFVPFWNRSVSKVFVVLITKYQTTCLSLLR